MSQLPEDLQRIIQSGAKIYDTKSKLQGKVVEIEASEVHIKYGKLPLSVICIEEFKDKLLKDEIVSQSRLTMGVGNNFKVLPRVNPPVTPNKPQSQIKTPPAKTPPGIELATAYINEKTGKFSKTKKKGYVKIEYRKVTQPVTLEVDDEMLEKLKELGLV